MAIHVTGGAVKIGRIARPRAPQLCTMIVSSLACGRTARCGSGTRSFRLAMRGMVSVFLTTLLKSQEKPVG